MIRRFLQALAALPERYGRPRTRTDYLAPLDGLRFIAILEVVVWHASLRASRAIDQRNALFPPGEHLSSLYGFFPHGEVGVDLFFMISGFIISRPFWVKKRRTTSVAEFYLRRIRRLYPPYVVALVASFALVLLSGHVATGAWVSPGLSLLASLGYVQGLVFDRASPLNPPLWSLEVEVQFYVAAPFILMLLEPMASSRMLRRGCMGLATVMLIILAAVANQVAVEDQRFRFGLISHAYLFVFGILLGDVADDVLGRSAGQRRWDLVFIAGLISAGVLGWALTQLDAHPRTGMQAILFELTLSFSCAACLLGGLCGGVSARVLSQPWIVFAGVMCYSVYLVHIILVEGVSQLVLSHLLLSNSLSIYLFYISTLSLASFGAGGVFFLLLERPFMRWPPSWRAIHA